MRPNVIMIGDFLKDLDDEHALVGASKLHRDGVIDLRCVIGNLHPAELRARGAKGTLQQLGLPDIPVGVGTPVFEGKIHPYEAEIPYLAEIDDIEEDGMRLLTRTLVECPDDSVILVLQSGLTDAAALLEWATVLCYSRIQQVAIMGGVEQEGDHLKLDARGFMVPNNANNNSFNMASATSVYTRLQSERIPTLTVTREVAYAVQVPFSMYDRMEATGNLIGRCLRNRQKPSLQHLWEAACSPTGSSTRGTLPNDRDRQWFINVFCDAKNPGIPDGSDIWPHVAGFNLYDPTNLYAAIPSIRDRFFEPTLVDVGGTQHMVIGLSPDRHGVKDIDGLRQFMIETEVSALRNAATIKE